MSKAQENTAYTFLQDLAELLADASREKRIIKDMSDAMEYVYTTPRDVGIEIDTVVKFLNKIKKEIA